MTYLAKGKALVPEHNMDLSMLCETSVGDK